MSKSNIEIVQEYIEVVLNQKHFDRTFEYCAEDCVMHFAPYVGLGVNFDDRSGDRLVLLDVAANGPAHGKLLVGDELVRVQDDHKTWETYKDLNTGLWGQGIEGTYVTLTVKRNGEPMDVPIVRGRVDGWDMKLSTTKDVWAEDIRKYWPDLKSEIKLIFGHDDLVAIYCINSGTNTEYHRSAVWGECDIYRLRDGLIVESWGVEDGFAEMNQLGFKLTEPEKEMV